MTRKYLLVCFFISLVLVAGTLLFHREQTNPTFSPTATNPPDLIDVLALSQDDYKHISKGEYNTVFLSNNQGRKQVFYDDKPIRSLALSPSQARAAFFYSPNNQSSEELTLILLEKESSTIREIYHTQFASWDVRSNLHWLGDDYIFFLRHCGTACKGITLLNLESVQTTNAVLSYPPFPDQPEQTHFKDWFGKEFVISGLVDDVESETVDNLHYLVFRMKDYEGNFLGEKKFQFTGTEVMEKN